jgi:putative transposase
MDGQPPKPTSRETTREQREAMVRLRAQGESYAAIAARLACSPWTVGRWVRAYAAAGPAALAYRSRRPRTPHPQTTPVAVQERIRAVRQRHPGWGARLIRRQLVLDGVADAPSEVTIQRWLVRQGFPLVRPLRHKPLGWPSPASSAAPVWQADFKQKGGPGI